MSDIVDRLRTLRFPGLDGEPCVIPADDPLYLEAADEIERLRDEREQLALAICGGEDAPGFANAQTVEKLVEIAEQNRREVAREYERSAADRADAIAARAQVRRYRDALYRIAGGTNYADDPWDIARFALGANEKSPDR